MCKKCGVALCVAPYFELHHTRVNPKRAVTKTRTGLELDWGINLINFFVFVF